jgi:hypothetical protein
MLESLFSNDTLERDTLERDTPKNLFSEAFNIVGKDLHSGEIQSDAGLFEKRTHES